MGSSHPETYEYVCVDGLQRTTALQKFVHNELQVFGQCFVDFEFGNFVATYNPLPEFRVNVFRNALTSRKDVLQWYIDMNACGTPHAQEEINRVRKMIEEL